MWLSLKFSGSLSKSNCWLQACSLSLCFSLSSFTFLLLANAFLLPLPCDASSCPLLNCSSIITLQKMNWCALNIKMGGAVDFFGDRKSLQGDVDKLDDWAITNQMKFKKSKCRILHLGWSSPGYIYWLGDESLEQPHGKGYWGFWLTTSWMCSQRSALAAKRKQMCHTDGYDLWSHAYFSETLSSFPVCIVGKKKKKKKKVALKRKFTVWKGTVWWTGIRIKLYEPL